MKKRIISMLLAVLMTMTVLGGCGNGNSANSENNGGQSEDPLKVAVQSYYCSALVGYIMDNNLAEEYDCPFEIEVFSSGATINEAMGEWDVAVTGGAFIYALANYDCKLIAHQLDGTSDPNIVVRKDSPILECLDDPEALAEQVKGKTILALMGSTQQYLLTLWLDSMGLTTSDVNIINQELSNIWASWKAGEADIAIINAPYSYYDLEAEVNSEIIATLDSVGGKLYESTVCTSDAYENRRDDVVKFVQMLYDACDALAADDELAVETAVKWYEDWGKGASEEEIRYEQMAKPYITSEQAREIDLTEFAMAYGKYYIDQGLIQEDRLSVIEANCANDILQEALN